MKAVLMAAGLGTRLSKKIPNQPKCLVDIGGKTLIENTIIQLQRGGFKDMAVVVGYQANKIIEVLKPYNISYFLNPFYDRTNSIASLWFAREFIQGDDFLFMNADVFFEEGILQEVMDEKLCPVMFVDKTRKLEGDYKFYYQDRILIKHGKELPQEEISGEYIGLAKIDNLFIPPFLERLNLLISNNKTDLWWENVLYSFINERNVYVKEIRNDCFWAEVDQIDDYNRILKHLGVQAFTGDKNEDSRGLYLEGRVLSETMV